MGDGNGPPNKWFKYAGPLTDDQVLSILNTSIEGQAATAAFINPATSTLFVGYYGEDD